MIRRVLISAFILAILISYTAYGARITVPAESPARPSHKSKYSFEINGNIHVDFAGVVRDTKAKGEALNCVFSFFLVTPQKDTKLEVASDSLFDSLGRKFEGPAGISIIGNGNPSEIIGGVPTLVWIVHIVPARHGELPVFAKMNFQFNGTPVEIRNVKTQEWESWKQKLSEIPMFESWLSTSPSAESMYSALQASHYWTGGKVFNGHHYKVFTDEKISWNAANVKCLAMGGHLVTITSQREQDFIDSIYTTAYDTDAWIGLYREGGYQENGSFKWVTEEPVTYTRWTDGHPVKDWHHDGRYAQHHWTYIFRDKEKKNWWAVWENEMKKYYICEWEF